MRIFALTVLILIIFAGIFGDILWRQSYSEQDRESISLSPSVHHPLGTDELGRDRLARVLAGTRVSLFLAPAAALLSTLLAAMGGGAAASLGGFWEKLFGQFTDMFLALPWLFVLLAVRALLPLNVSPWVSVSITFALLGCLGWPSPARIVRSGARSLLQSDFLWQARAMGIPPSKIFWRYLLPNLRPILTAQCLLSLPVFILGEANLSLLGLGVSEPLPSWGSLLRELRNYAQVQRAPWVLCPLVVLVTTVCCVQVLLRGEEAES